MGEWLKVWIIIKKVLFFKLFIINQTPITIVSITLFLLVLFGLFYISNKIVSLCVKVIPKKRFDDNAVYIISKIVRYILLTLSFVFSLQLIGISLTSMAVMFGFLSVGIGFGLKNITSNFISGIVLLFEQPIKVGDLISINNVEGYVKDIKIRSTIIQTMDDRTIIVPNSYFIESEVTNWSYASQSLRIKINIGVSYDSDLQLVLDALYEVAKEHPDVLKEPEPYIRFVEFGDSALNLFLAVWVKNSDDYYRVKSELHCSIVNKFRKNKIEIPFPQRDLHIKNKLSGGRK